MFRKEGRIREHWESEKLFEREKNPRQLTVSLLSHSASKMEAVMKAHTSKHYSRDYCCGYRSSPGRHQPCLRSHLISHTVPKRHRSWPLSPDPQLHHDHQARLSPQWDDTFNVKTVQINTKTSTERKERRRHSRDVHPFWSPGKSDHIIPRSSQLFLCCSELFSHHSFSRCWRHSVLLHKCSKALWKRVRKTPLMSTVPAI